MDVLLSTGPTPSSFYQVMVDCRFHSTGPLPTSKICERLGGVEGDGPSQNSGKRRKKSRIRETKHLSTDADSSTDAIGGSTKAKSAKKNIFSCGDFRPLRKKKCSMLNHFFPLLFPKDSESLKILDIRLREVGAKDR